MRTTVNLPDDVHQAALSMARLQRISLGEALAELARRGLRPEIRINSEEAFPCFQLREGSPAISLERTLELEDEL